MPDRRGALAAGVALSLGLVPAAAPGGGAPSIPLTPVQGAPHTLQAAMAARRSVRRYSSAPLSLQCASELLWAGQGVSSDGRRRTVPSAGGLYPLELYLLARRVQGLSAGVYHYQPGTHTIEATPGHVTPERLTHAAVGQAMVGAAPAVLAILARHAFTAAKYGVRAERYVSIEAGAAAQNIALKAAALGLGTVVVGGFDEDEVTQLLRLPPGLRPLVLMPVGTPA
ncbi:MAG: SagB/ThcOx family dehydrogenase [Burkholderiaceae bacterium]|nr:SagB/ThcOx family dehydrogenase [Burkholderiaceae bacterium]